MKKICTITIISSFLFYGGEIFSQSVGINSIGAPPNASALLDIDATPGNNKGILIPRLTLTQTSSNAPIGVGIATSLLAYNTATVNDVTPGFYYWDGVKWVRMLNGGSAAPAWLTLGNAGTTAGTNFLGTTDAQDVVIKANNTEGFRLYSGGIMASLGVGVGAAPITTSAQATLVLKSSTSNFQINAQDGSRTALLWNASGTGGNYLVTGEVAVRQRFHVGAIGGYIDFAGAPIGTAGTPITWTTMGAMESSNYVWFSPRGTSSDFYIPASTGNVGIGTTNPDVKLSVFGSGVSGYARFTNTDFVSGSVGSGLLFTSGANSGNTYSIINAYSAGFLAWNNLILQSGGGNVGIGTTSPNEQLEITNNFRLPATTGATAGVIYSGANRYIHNYGTDNFFAGVNAGNFTMTGIENTAIGINALISNTSGNSNTANGFWALYHNTTACCNTANGFLALYWNNTGSMNTAIGDGALQNNTSGNNNTAIGDVAMQINSTGSDNTAIGLSALRFNSTGSDNTTIGFESLFNNTTGIQNSATGSQALFINTTGNYNIATGYQALYSNTTGSYNTATGVQALKNNTIGNSNVAYGWDALLNTTTGTQNTSIGLASLTQNITGSNNTALGAGADCIGFSALSNSTVLGANANVNLSNKVRIGDPTVTVVEGQVAYSFPSDGRFKNNVTEAVPGLDFINRLRPIVYNFDTRKFDAFLMQTMKDSLREAIMSKKDYRESTAIRQSGFIAQEVEQAAKESGYNFNGVHKPSNENDNYSVAYSLFVVPLVKAVQELNTKNEEQQKVIDSQQLTIDNLKTANDKQQTEFSTLKSDYDARLKTLEKNLGTKAEK